MSRAALRVVPSGADAAIESVAGDRSATPADRVEAAYRQYHDWVFYLGMRYGGADRAWAEDVLQDVFIALLRQFERGVEVTNLRGWLLRTTTNRCLTKLRRARFLEAPGVRALLGSRLRRPATPEELGIVDDDLRIVAEVIGAASAKERACFFLHHIDDLNLREVGETIGHSKGYVSKLLARVQARIERARGEARDDG